MPAGTAGTLRQSYATMQAFWNPVPGGQAAGPAGLFNGPVRNYPNPFRIASGPTKFVALMNLAGKVDIKIYDAGGQFVTSLSQVASGPGRLELAWDGRNNQGAYVSP